MSALRSHGYPFTIPKSYLTTIGVQHTWPSLLAALSYLRICVEVQYRALHGPGGLAGRPGRAGLYNFEKPLGQVRPGQAE